MGKVVNPVSIHKINESRVAGLDAWDNLLNQNPSSRWHVPLGSTGYNNSCTKRYQDPFFVPTVNNTFTFNRKETIFTIGSCFARTLEKYLNKSGFNVLSFKHAPKFSNALQVMNKYNPEAMLAELRWALDPEYHFKKEFLIELDDSNFADPHSYGGRGSLEESLLLREQMIACTKKIKESSLIVITLGLIESWFDRAHNLYLNSTPPYRACMAYPERFELRVLSYTQCMEALEKIYQLLAKNCPKDFKLILSVSPVPMQATFTKDDVVVANTQTKSQLRIAAQDFARLYDNIDYFPSYEFVMNSPRGSTWQEDTIHVTPTAVEGVMSSFINSYCNDPDLSETARQNLNRFKRVEPVDDRRCFNKELIPDLEVADENSLFFPGGLPEIITEKRFSTDPNPSHLLYGAEAVWHSVKKPKYPLTIHISFQSMLKLRSLWLLSQDKNPARAPGSFMLQAKINDEFVTVFETDSVNWIKGDQWHNFTLPAPITAKKFRLIIRANSGDPTLCTLKRIWFEPIQ